MENNQKVDNLQRFVVAQDGGCRWSDVSYEDALSEVRNGNKTSHWIWYIFPQMKGLGFSDASKYYGIVNREEAKAYIEHPINKNSREEVNFFPTFFVHLEINTYLCRSIKT